MHIDYKFCKLNKLLSLQMLSHTDCKIEVLKYLYFNWNKFI